MSEESSIVKTKKHIARNKKKYSIGGASVLASVIVYLQFFAAVCPVLPSSWGLKCEAVKAASDNLQVLGDKLAPDAVLDAGD